MDAWTWSACGRCTSASAPRWNAPPPTSAPGSSGRRPASTATATWSAGSGVSGWNPTSPPTAAAATPRRPRCSTCCSAWRPDCSPRRRGSRRCTRSRSRTPPRRCGAGSARRTSSGWRAPVRLLARLNGNDLQPWPPRLGGAACATARPFLAARPGGRGACIRPDAGLDQVAVGGLPKTLGRYRAGGARQPLEITPHPLEGGDPLGQPGGVPVDQPGHVGAGDLPTVADGEDLADLPKRQADRLGGADEPQPCGGLGLVVAVAGCGPGWLGQQARTAAGYRDYQP